LVLASQLRLAQLQRLGDGRHDGVLHNLDRFLDYLSICGGVLLKQALLQLLFMFTHLFQIRGHVYFGVKFISCAVRRRTSIAGDLFLFIGILIEEELCVFLGFNRDVDAFLLSLTRCDSISSFAATASLPWRLR
jgi:hypothetical protein